MDTIYRKRSRLDTAAVLAGKVRAAKAYQAKMSKSLTEDDFVRATTRIDEFHDATINEKQATERQINNLEARIQRLNSQLGTLRYDLARCED
jgi:TolA-binding protein